MIRINKALSHLGVCSRREADSLVAEGRVTVNGVVCKFGQQVNDDDIICVDKVQYNIKNIPTEKIWLFYKPIGVITSRCDTEGRKTVFDIVNVGERIISVGRLDINSEGLLLLTNSPSFASYAQTPGLWKRVYKVRVFGVLSDDIINSMANGMIIDGIKYKPIHVKILSNNAGKNVWCECTLEEGKNREIRKIFEHFGILVNRLIRIQYGPYKLDKLTPGEIKRVK